MKPDLSLKIQAAINQLIGVISGLDHALQISHDWSLDATGGSDGPRAIGGHSDPTATTAIGETATNDTTYRRLVGALEAAIGSVNEICVLIEECRRVTPREANRRLRDADDPSKATTCAQVACDDLADGGLHCGPCQLWLQSHPDCRVVPRATIAVRQRVRKYRSPQAVS